MCPVYPPFGDIPVLASCTFQDFACEQPQVKRKHDQHDGYTEDDFASVKVLSQSIASLVGIIPSLSHCRAFSPPCLVTVIRT